MRTKRSQNTTTGFKTCFVARSSEKVVVKARGEKGSEACWSTLRTLFAENADPRALQPIAAERGFETSCKLLCRAGQYIICFFCNIRCMNSPYVYIYKTVKFIICIIVFSILLLLFCDNDFGFLIQPFLKGFLLACFVELAYRGGRDLTEFDLTLGVEVDSVVHDGQRAVIDGVHVGYLSAGSVLFHADG